MVQKKESNTGFRPPPTDSGILGMYRDPNIITTTWSLPLVVTTSGWGPNLKLKVSQGLGRTVSHLWGDL